MQFETASCSRFVVLELLLSFCYVTDDMESRSQGQCSAKHDGTTRAHASRQQKNEGEKNFPRYAPLYTAMPSAVAVPLQRTSPRFAKLYYASTIHVKRTRGNSKLLRPKGPHIFTIQLQFSCRTSESN